VPRFIVSPAKSRQLPPNIDDDRGQAAANSVCFLTFSIPSRKLRRRMQLSIPGFDVDCHLNRPDWDHASRDVEKGITRKIGGLCRISQFTAPLPGYPVVALRVTYCDAVVWALSG
jgi:hypothetical protein